MKPTIAIVFFVVTSYVVYGQQDDEKEWKDFKDKYGKSFKNPSEENKRKNIFKANKKNIQNHNSKFQTGQESYELGENEFLDMDADEFMATHANLRLSQVSRAPVYAESAPMVGAPPKVGAPASWDWRTYGAVNMVKNQANCGSCWSFSVVGAVESCRKIAGKPLWSLSEQELVDCNTANSGCNGGWMTTAFDYIKTYGLLNATSYPYTAVGAGCRYNSSLVVARITGYTSVTATEVALVDAVWKTPVSVAVDASGFQFYKSGVFNYQNCTTTVTHAVLVVGYGTASPGGDFWLVKNSWGLTWGEAGYIRMARNKNNQCCIACYGSYPTGCT